MKAKKTTQWWKQTIERWKASGQAQKAFCQEQRISFWAFRNWKTKLTGSTEQEPGFVEIQGLLPKQCLHGTRIRITFPSGIAIEVDEAKTIEELKAIISAVGSL
jgi:hypothetical protein